MSLLDEVLARRIVPVVVVRDSARAAGLADALVAADLPIAEVTLRSARTIADLAASRDIDAVHLSEAIQYRRFDPA